MNPAKRELLKKESLLRKEDSLLADGLIEECESPYASPVVLVPTTNGSMRLCVDFRKLNATTIADTYPLPRMDDLLTEDASSYAHGAALSQGEGSEEHVIEYASRLLIPAERNYSSTEREALAVVWAVEKFRGYVEDQEIIITSVHQPLKWLMSIKSPSGRLARWALQILPGSDYTPGKANVLEDMLSRPTNLTEDVPCDIFAVSSDFPMRNSKDIRTKRQERLRDEELK
ncbi:Retrovirus-related Pol polyprotein from transposon 297 [Araneus ventricosus]|uniref:Retrovirus-related Pol polyprotein from transposon 297 n=1 Tax=Araneus ventricosus TaxID=182803 RepID=A0A4Y2FH71_ARAVE|nr:Retrovirus-related Pol polyprotein from transposon 297 [Araneus ventricosus]